MKDFTKHIECLARVRRSLQRRNAFVCVLIKSDHATPREVRMELVAWIETLMGLDSPSYTLETWLFVKYRINAIDRRFSTNDMRKLRLRWINWIIRTLQGETTLKKVPYE
jgi:hypothetical protein